jgi:hypothetical protein
MSIPSPSYRTIHNKAIHSSRPYEQQMAAKMGNDVLEFEFPTETHIFCT